MLVFAAVVYDRPQARETIYIDERLFTRIASGDREAFQDY